MALIGTVVASYRLISSPSFQSGLDGARACCFEGPRRAGWADRGGGGISGRRGSPGALQGSRYKAIAQANGQSENGLKYLIKERNSPVFGLIVSSLGVA